MEENSMVRLCPIGGIPKSNQEAYDRKFKLLERKIYELTNTIIVLQERITTLELEKA